MSNSSMRSQFDCTPEQYHAGLDKLWAALGLTGPQEHDVFTLAAAEIEQLRRLNQDKFNHLQAYCRAASIDKHKIRLLHDATVVLRNGMGGHNHWDHTMQHGAGCEVCIQQQRARDEATRLIEEVSKL